MPMTMDIALGERLVSQGALSPEGLRETLEIQEQRGGRLTDLLLREERVTEKALLEALALELGLDFRAHLDIDAIEPALVSALQITWAKSYLVLPLKDEEDFVVVAVNDPFQMAPLDDLRAIYGRPVEPVLSTKDQI